MQEPVWLQGVEGQQVRPLITTDAPFIRVSAGAGTGKTFGIRKRVLRILHPTGLNIEPTRVLVCAFNRVIARDLERELLNELGPHNLALPQVRTVHSLAATLLKGKLPRLLLDHESGEMTYDIRAQYPQVRQEFTQRRALRALREHEAGFAQHPALAIAAKGWLTEHGAALIGDVPRRADAAARAGEFEDAFAHILVDEFQDLTDLEIRLLLALREEGCQFVAVGDRKQSIYSFRGNAPRGLQLLDDLADGPILDLTMDECRRCRDEIVGLANDVVALEGEPIHSTRGAGAQLHHVLFNTKQEQARRIGDEVARVFNANPLASHLVLVTRHDWGYAIRDRILANAPGTPVHTAFAEDVLHTWPAREAFVFFSAVCDENDAVTMRDWIAYRHDAKSGDFLAPDRNAYAYLNVRQQHGGTLTRTRIEDLHEMTAPELGGAGCTHIVGRIQRLRVLWNDLPLDRSPQAVVAHIFDPANWVDDNADDRQLARDDIERLARECARIVDERPDATLKDLATQLRYRIGTREPVGIDPAPGVRIVTLWGAKGLTADYVYLVGLFDEALPGPHDPDSTGLDEPEHLDEQRRLLYVSLTRARESLVLSRIRRIRTGEVKRLGLLRTGNRQGYWQFSTPCRFFDDVAPQSLPAAQDNAHWAGVNV